MQDKEDKPMLEEKKDLQNDLLPQNSDKITSKIESPEN